MGEAARSEAEEIKAIEAAIQMGYRLIDTAEMYASGNTESLIGKAPKSLDIASAINCKS